jgi:hypothetical protein
MEGIGLLRLPGYPSRMPKNSGLEMLRRWQALDAELAGKFGLNVPDFAQRWNVCEKTVRCDLELFRQLGQKMSLYLGLWGPLPVDERGNPTLPAPRDRSYDRWGWTYDEGTVPLFTSNLPSEEGEKGEEEGEE